MSFRPELIEVALFTLLSDAVADLGLQSVERHAKIWGNVAPPNQPVAYLSPDGFEIVQNQVYGASKYTLFWLFQVFAKADGNPNAIPPPQTLLNNIAQAVVGALAALPPGQRQTLGGLVENCWIEGRAPMDPGILDKQCWMGIPIRAITAI